MHPAVMTALLLIFLAMFAYSANRRWQLLRAVGKPENRTDRLTHRFAAVLRFAFWQARLRRYPLSGVAHNLVFFGFVVLLLRSLVLFGRGFDPSFDLWILGEHTALGAAYVAVKDWLVLAVLVGALAFLYIRLVQKPARMSLSGEGILILVIIVVMMLADMAYDASLLLPAARAEGAEVGFSLAVPAGTLAAIVLGGVSPGTLEWLGQAGFWTHVSLVLVFLNILPYSKHFHVLTAIPNVFALDLTPRGRLRPIEGMEDKVERGETLGVLHVEDLTWKGVLDLYTCTECGRCTDNCPANKTGKLLSPKRFTLDLRDHIYAREKELVEGALVGDDGHDGAGAHAAGDGHEEKHGHDGEHGHDDEDTSGPPRPQPLLRHKVELVPHVIQPEVLWACTTCRACEEECPVLISYVDKIVGMRRALIMDKEQVPKDLRTAFMGLETNKNPWNLAAIDRAEWAEGLDIPQLASKPSTEYLLWVGCAAAYDQRARSIARATARLLQLAEVDFGILGTEEGCTGDAARRAGNEYLFEMLARDNVETLDGYGVRKIITICPHCYNALANEYRDFGGTYEVVHHSQFLLGLVREGRIPLRESLSGEGGRPTDVVFHDSCYLGRYNDVYDPPRDLLSAVPGVNLVEVAASRDRGLCCGAGGAQFWKEEEHGRTRVAYERTDQLLACGAKIIASACPFCMTMIDDGLKQREREDVEQLDIAEILLRACAVDRPAGEPAESHGTPMAAPSRGRMKDD